MKFYSFCYNYKIVATLMHSAENVAAEFENVNDLDLHFYKVKHFGKYMYKIFSAVYKHDRLNCPPPTQIQ